jgi:DmsE family decaheme c-type cytochrome
MVRRLRAVSPSIWLASSFLIWMMAFASARAKAPAVSVAAGNSPVAAAVQQAQVPAPVPYDAEGYVGEKSCIECHDAQKGAYYESVHSRATDPRTPAARKQCETCHGPTGQHADDPVIYPIKNDFTKMAPAATTAICTTCHNRGEHALWDGSQHEARGVTCTNCHSMHSPKSEDAQLVKATQLQVCSTCHQDKVAKLQRSAHMPVREGKLECTTCHNTHGSTNTKLLRAGDSVGEACTSCHAEKRGPYLWEHAPGRDGCVSCHDPHGTSNDRMLVTRTPMLCQRCHVATRHPSTIYDAAALGGGTSPTARVAGRSCVECHAAIHGSNHPSGQRFLR